MNSYKARLPQPGWSTINMFETLEGEPDEISRLYDTCVEAWEIYMDHTDWIMWFERNFALLQDEHNLVWIEDREDVRIAKARGKPAVDMHLPIDTFRQSVSWQATWVRYIQAFYSKLADAVGVQSPPELVR